MIVVDSGVAVAAFASWHESHDQARRVVALRPQIVAHALLETFSVLTRLPAPHRARAALVARFVEGAFTRAPLTLTAGQLRTFVIRRLPATGICGGTSYDALIAETVRAAGGTLVTLDQRALTTYDRIGCNAELLTRSAPHA